MLPVDALARGAHAMTVCNACRYCEQYCPVFPAVERRAAFGEGDLALLANLCHNCGECLYACPYAPPHEFGIDVPRTLAEIRLRSYESWAWPRPLAGAFRRHGPATAVVLAVACVAACVAFAAAWRPTALQAAPRQADFYAVVPHAALVALFGGVAVFVLAAWNVALRRAWRAMCQAGGPAPVTMRALAGAVRDAATLRHLHGGGVDCVSGEETRTPWRRWWHHATVGGFLLCLASTSVAAIYHWMFGWVAPYPYTSLPVVLGTAGGVGLVAGPIGQWVERRRRDPALQDPVQRGLDESLLVLLWLTSVTGLLLLVLRARPVMGPLLLVHLGVVLALFITLPYGKFVHGLYRLLALVRDAAERDRDERV